METQAVVRQVGPLRRLAIAILSRSQYDFSEMRLTFLRKTCGNWLLPLLSLCSTFGHCAAAGVSDDSWRPDERQITSGAHNHLLTNVGVWSRDGQWIYYDTRGKQDGSIFDGTRIERVHIDTRQVEVVYRSDRGACCGVVTACPVSGQIVFIHGPEDPTAEWSYSAWHRRGVLLDVDGDRVDRNLDARDLVSPFTAGALRGGSHVHVFSGDGRWISFTYEDHVLASSNDSESQRNQRNVGVAVPSLGPVTTPNSHPRNHSGVAFSVIVTETSDAPRRGSDQISRAYSDAWVGRQGYIRADGRRQARALAFIGDVVGESGEIVPELFIVDLPDDPTRAGSEPLCGTNSTRPAPPRGVVQRRLTNTTSRKFPGMGGVRHWPRSNPDGSKVAFLMRDNDGIAQLWTISPTGKDLQQLTHNAYAIASAFTWRPDGQAIACVANGSICEVNISTGCTSPLTRIREEPGLRAPRPEAVVYSPDGSWIAYARSVEGGQGAFSQIFAVESGLATEH